MNKTPSSLYKIRFNDCDMFGHLNNARYLDYMINARQDHLKETYKFDFNSYYKNGFGWVVSNHEIQYLKPAFFDETVLIQSCILNVDSESLDVEILMMNESRIKLKAILRSKLYFIDLKTGRKTQHGSEFMSWVGTLVVEKDISNVSLKDRIQQVMDSLVDVQPKAIL